MNAKQWAAFGFLLFCVMVLMTVWYSSTKQAGASLKTIKIRALIDGDDILKIQGDKCWFEHQSWRLPGKGNPRNDWLTKLWRWSHIPRGFPDKWQYYNEPTLINNKSWHPQWHGKISDPFVGLKPAFDPHSPSDIKLTKLIGRGTVTISGLPTPGNNQTLSIRFDDVQFGAAAWYEVVIDWHHLDIQATGDSGIPPPPVPEVIAPKPAANSNAAPQISKDPSMKSITIKAFIDGADTLKIQAGRIWYEHESYDLPGKWQNRDEPTRINDKPWLPVWHGKVSDPFNGLAPAFEPRFPAEVKLTALSARGPVAITQLPAPGNDGTLSIRFDDSSLQFQGADWYEVRIDWK